MIAIIEGKLEEIESALVKLRTICLQELRERAELKVSSGTEINPRRNAFIVFFLALHEIANLNWSLNSTPRPFWVDKTDAWKANLYSADRAHWLKFSSKDVDTILKLTLES